MKLIGNINLNNIRGDITGGITAAIVALPFALAMGLTSGAGAEAGLYGAIITGFFCSNLWRHTFTSIWANRSNDNCDVTDSDKISCFISLPALRWLFLRCSWMEFFK